MAITWDDIQRVKNVEARANAAGFKLSKGSYTHYDSAAPNILVYLQPLDDAYPHYNRDAEIFNGTLETIDNWLRGFEWARDYEELLKTSNSKKRGEKEQQERNKQLMRTIKTGRKVQGVAGSSDLNELRAFQEDEFVYADDGGTGAGY